MSEPFFLARAADFLVESEVQDSWVVTNADELFMEAVSQTRLSRRFESTPLAAKLKKLAESATQIAIWYASYSVDLEIVTTSNALLECVDRQILQSGNEVYLQFRRTTKVRFEVETVSRMRHRKQVVFARILDQFNFSLTPETTLLGTRIDRLTQPRALAPDRTPRYDLFGFEVAPSIVVSPGDVIFLENVAVRVGRNRQAEGS